MRVNVDTIALSDPRFAKAALRLGIARAEVLGRCVYVWHHAYERRSPHIERADVDALAEFHAFGDALVHAGLAREEGEQLYLCGVTDRIEFLLAQDAKRKQAIAARKQQASDDRRRRETPRGIPGETPGHIPRETPGRMPISPSSPTSTSPDPAHPPGNAGGHPGGTHVSDIVEALGLGDGWAAFDAKERAS